MTNKVTFKKISASFLLNGSDESAEDSLIIIFNSDEFAIKGRFGSCPYTLQQNIKYDQVGEEIALSQNISFPFSNNYSISIISNNMTLQANAIQPDYKNPGVHEFSVLTNDSIPVQIYTIKVEVESTTLSSLEEAIKNFQDSRSTLDAGQRGLWKNMSYEDIKHGKKLIYSDTLPFQGEWDDFSGFVERTLDEDNRNFPFPYEYPLKLPKSLNNKIENCLFLEKINNTKYELKTLKKGDFLNTLQSNSLRERRYHPAQAQRSICNIFAIYILALNYLPVKFIYLIRSAFERAFWYASNHKTYVVQGKPLVEIELASRIDDTKGIQPVDHIWTESILSWYYRIVTFEHDNPDYTFFDFDKLFCEEFLGYSEDLDTTIDLKNIVKLEDGSFEFRKRIETYLIGEITSQINAIEYSLSQGGVAIILCNHLDFTPLHIEPDDPTLKNIWKEPINLIPSDVPPSSEESASPDETIYPYPSHSILILKVLRKDENFDIEINSTIINFQRGYCFIIYNPSNGSFNKLFINHDMIPYVFYQILIYY